MLTPYRRHSAKCPHEPKGRAHKNCKCPIWADGVFGNREVRLSLKTRDWNEASRKILRMEAEGRTGGRVALSTAWDSFLADLEAQGVTQRTVEKYKLLRRRLEVYAEERRFVYVADISLDLLTSFRVTWKYGPRTAAKHIERLRAFFRFCTDRHWTESNPALRLKAPKVTICPTLPLSKEEWGRIVIACDAYEVEAGAAGFLNAQRLRTLIRVMRYCGLRISDAVSLSTDRITDDKLFLYTQKTGTPVYTVLPSFLVKELAATPRVTDKLYFWSGNGELESSTKDWQAKIRKLFDLASVDKGENFMVSHRFRDTFAVECLLAGVPLERVSVLLGHSSVRVTERHYAPWVQKRQQQLEADLRSMWANDQTGTNQVQKKNARPN